MKAIRMHAQGGAEVLKYEDVTDPTPAAGQVLVQIEAAGLNFIDIYKRSGLYKMPLPAIIGQEAAGVVKALGAGVTGFKAGDRVAFNGLDGSYAQYQAVPADKLVPMPAGIDSRTAAAVLLQGMTAHYLVNDTYPLKPGDTCLLHAAAGGVGLLLIQMAKMRGARVIGTVSTADKAKLAREAGADEVINYATQDFEAETRSITGGRGVQVVYDSVGKATFDKSLNCLAPRGLMALFGTASGPVPPVDINQLGPKGSLFITRPNLVHHTLTRADLLKRSGEVFEMVRSGKLKVKIDQTWPLSQAADAHRKLESRASTGKLLLIL
jgi:NADPH2:quinone reductase